MNEPAIDPAEPSGCTLADLMALTVGSAIACSFFWYSYGIDSTTISGRTAPEWFLWENRGIELFQKSCVALIPVILLRRRRYGGPLRPVDYSVILMGLSQLFLTIWHWQPLVILYKPSPTSRLTLVNMEAFRAWKLSKFAIGIMAGLVVVFRRYRRVDCVSGVMIALSWCCLTESFTQAYQDWGNSMLQSPSPRWPLRTVQLLSTILVQGPISVLTYLPFAILIIDLFRSRRRQKLWVEQVSIVLVYVLMIGFQWRTIARQILTSGFDSGVAMNLGIWLAWIVLACVLARIFEPVWRRFLECPSIHSPAEAQL
jgi:hypothetical protein